MTELSRRTIFYSWQSDTRAAANRSLIQDALEAAVAGIASDGSLEIDLVVDRDTQGVAGAPEIGATILAKIDASAVVVADVSITIRIPNVCCSPNPNVLIEVGYALKSRGPTALVLVQNLAFGSPEELPFDLRGKRVLTYNSPEDAVERAAERRKLQAGLREAIEAILPGIIAEARKSPVSVSLEHETEHTYPEFRIYRAIAKLRNLGSRRIDDWSIEIELPTALVPPNSSNQARIESESNATRTVYRYTSVGPNSAIYPQRETKVRLPYRVDGAVVQRRARLLGERITVKAYIDGILVSVVERRVEEMHDF